jgi:outer membrane immunogenic protein
MVEPGAFLQFARTLFGPPGGDSLTSPIPDPETPYSIHSKPWSYTAGGFLGYNLQYGSYVVGLEGDAAWKNGQSTNSLYATTTALYGAAAGTGPAPTALRTESFNGTLKQTWDSSIRARAGFLYSPWILVYATGGVAFGEVSGSFGYSASITYTAPGVAVPTTSGGMTWSDTRVGWTVGGGVETEVAAGWKVRVEYRYTDLGTYSKNIPLAFSCTGAGICPTPTIISTNAQVNLHPTFQTIRVGLAFNF